MSKFKLRISSPTVRKGTARSRLRAIDTMPTAAPLRLFSHLSAFRPIKLYKRRDQSDFPALDCRAPADETARFCRSWSSCGAACGRPSASPYFFQPRPAARRCFPRARLFHLKIFFTRNSVFYLHGLRFVFQMRVTQSIVSRTCYPPAGRKQSKPKFVTEINAHFFGERSRWLPNRVSIDLPARSPGALAEQNPCYWCKCRPPRQMQAAGKTTSAYAVVSVSNISWTTIKSLPAKSVGVFSGQTSGDVERPGIFQHIGQSFFAGHHVVRADRIVVERQRVQQHVRPSAAKPAAELANKACAPPEISPPNIMIRSPCVRRWFVMIIV